MNLEDQAMIARARYFAAKKHLGQTRKYTGEPYIVHPVAVAERVRASGGTPNMIAAALLHDVLEDTDATVDEIESITNREVAMLVIELTDQYTSEFYPELNRKVRKRLEAERLATVSPEAKAIKHADMADNTATIVQHDPGFAKVYLREKAELLELMEGTE
jgi:(p)ppGpp synthase/HD superfamily hydrolase